MTAVDDALIICRALHFASLMLGFGTAAFFFYVPLGSTPGIMAVLDRRLGWLLLAAALLALLSGLLMVPAVAARMAASASAAIDWRIIATVLSQTAFGRVWRWHLLLTAALVVASALPARHHALRATLAALALASLGLVGHAVDGRGWAALVHEVNDAAHLLAAALWIGGLAPLLALAIPARRHRDWLEMLRQALPRFSCVASAAVALLALTGVGNMLFLVDSLTTLTQTAYGRLLLAKLALFLLLLMVAAMNRFVLSPRIIGTASGGRSAITLSWAIAVEQGLAAAVIGIVAVLGTLAPGMHGH